MATRLGFGVLPTIIVDPDDDLPDIVLVLLLSRILLMFVSTALIIGLRICEIKLMKPRLRTDEIKPKNDQIICRLLLFSIDYSHPEPNVTFYIIVFPWSVRNVSCYRWFESQGVGLQTVTITRLF